MIRDQDTDAAVQNVLELWDLLRDGVQVVTSNSGMDLTVSRSGECGGKRVQITISCTLEDLAPKSAIAEVAELEEEDEE